MGLKKRNARVSKVMSAKDYCIKEAAWHIERANEILREGLSDPERFREESQKTYKTMAPFVATMMCYSILTETHGESHTPPSQQN